MVLKSDKRFDGEDFGLVKGDEVLEYKQGFEKIFFEKNFQKNFLHAEIFF